MQIAGHLGYANAFVGLPWLNAPYWSLAIEFQFYILMGLALPLLMLAGTPSRRLAGLALASCLAMLLPSGNATLLPFLPVFAAGTLTFLLPDSLVAQAGHRSYSAAHKEAPMKKILMTLCAFAFVLSTAGISVAGAPAEKDTKAAKDKPAKEEKSAPAPKADDKAAGEKAKK